LAALSEKSNNDEDTCVNQETASEELPLENSGSMKATDLKTLSSEPVESSKVGVALPSSIERDVHECSVYLVRMKTKLPLQQTNEMVEKLAVSGNKMSVWNDSNVCDSLENAVQSITELCIVEDSGCQEACCRIQGKIH